MEETLLLNVPGVGCLSGVIPRLFTAGPASQGKQILIISYCPQSPVCKQLRKETSPLHKDALSRRQCLSLKMKMCKPPHGSCEQTQGEGHSTPALHKGTAAQPRSPQCLCTPSWALPAPAQANCPGDGSVLHRGHSSHH